MNALFYYYCYTMYVFLLHYVLLLYYVSVPTAVLDGTAINCAILIASNFMLLNIDFFKPQHIIKQDLLYS